MPGKKKVTVAMLLAEEKYEALVRSCSYEEGVALLEELVEQVEEGGLPLEDAVGAYERGVALTGHLRALLEKAEARLAVLNEDGETLRPEPTLR